MNSKKNWTLQIDPSVYKSLKRFPRKEIDKILSTINDLSYDPYAGDLKKIKGESHVWRKRIGSYRLFFEIYPNDTSVYIFHVERRTSKTYR